MRFIICFNSNLTLLWLNIEVFFLNSASLYFIFCKFCVLFYFYYFILFAYIYLLSIDYHKSNRNELNFLSGLNRIGNRNYILIFWLVRTLEYVFTSIIYSRPLILFGLPVSLLFIVVNDDHYKNNDDMADSVSAETFYHQLFPVK